MSGLISNLATIIVSLVLMIAAVIAGRYLQKSKKEGTCAGCGGSCNSCSQCKDASDMKR